MVCRWPVAGVLVNEACRIIAINTVGSDYVKTRPIRPTMRPLVDGIIS